MKELLNNLLFSIFLLLLSCNNETKSLIQKIKTDNLQLNLYKINSGSFGESAEIEIVDNKGVLLEKIGLRGEDYLPRIDSVNNNNLFISYSYPTQTEKLEFEQVVLGDALLNKSKLKFKYNFNNIKQ